MAFKKKKPKTRKSVQKEPSPSISKSISKSRLWMFRLTAMIGVPLAILICLELGLRLMGWGYSTEIATKQTVNGSERYCYNSKMGWRFFPKKIARDLSGFAFDVKKSPQTYRIFVLGASAAQGIPNETYNFGRFLEIMLENEYPQTDFEVINVAMTAINSHAVYQIAKSCARFEPDLMIVYLGNNEVIGPYGAGTIFTPLSPNLMMIRLNNAITTTRTGQLFQSMMDAVGSKREIPQSWGGMEMFLDEQIRPESDVLEVVYSHYEKNLKDICQVGIRAGAKVVLSNVACNLKDNAPFASLHREDLTDTEKQAWEQRYREGITHETAGELETAVTSYLAAETIDDAYADLQFRLGRCYWRLGEYAKARDCYILAREYDTLRFRADSRINHIIRSVAEGREDDGVYFVDAIKAVEANSPHEIPGNELFYEHVHYRFEGNYILAKTIFEQVKKTLPEHISQHRNNRLTMTLADCQDRLVFTTYERYQTAEYVLDNLINKPPFTNQSYHDEQIEDMEGESEQFKQETIMNLENVAVRYAERISQYPQDWRLRWRLASFYAKDPTKVDYAILELKKILKFIPYDGAYHGLALLLMQQGNLDEAEQYARERVKIRPVSVVAHLTLGTVMLKKEDYREAIKHFSKIIKLQPSESANAYRSLAQAYEKQGHHEKAIQTLYLAVEKIPKEEAAMVYIDLGLLLGKNNRSEEAVQILTTGISEFPPDQIENEQDVFALLLQLDLLGPALEFYERMLTVYPDSIVILNNMAWYKATCDDEVLRNPEEAIQYAQKACSLTNYISGQLMDTLAAAYASAGDFERAVATAKKAVERANENGQPDVAEEIMTRLRLYQKGVPYRDKVNP